MPGTTFIIRVAVRAKKARSNGSESTVMPSIDVNRTKSAGIVPAARVPHDADGSDREQNGERLPDLIVQTFPPDFLDVYMVCFSENFQLFVGDFRSNGTKRLFRDRKRVPSSRVARTVTRRS